MSGEGRTITVNRERFRFRRVLVAVQVALSFVLLCGALLFSRSLRNLLTLDAGFRQTGVLQVHVFLPPAGVSSERSISFHREFLEKLRSIPGVDGASLSRNTPFGGNFMNNNVRPGDAPSAAPVLAEFNRVSGDYFRVIGTPLLSGRTFDQRDTASAPKVAIVSQVLAERLFGKTSALGKTLREESDPKAPDQIYEIVGIAGNTKHNGLRGDFTPYIYLPDSQEAAPGLTWRYVLHSNAPLESVLPPIRREVEAVGATVRFAALEDRVRETLLRERLMATLSGGFGSLAAVLAVAGLYGVVSYIVARRQAEIGIRVALGATRGDILGFILGGVGRLLAAGVAVGVVLFLVLARYVAEHLYGIEPTDVWTLSGAIGLLSVATLVASLVPALRASSIDPARVLRAD
jgi:predicted permease